MRFCEQCRAAFQSLRTCPRDNVPTRADISDPLIGAVLGDRYRVLDRIAAGGMGQVYRAGHVRIASLFAVKVLYGDGAHDPAMRSRFLREAEAASCLSSRHIVRVVDFGESAEGLSYLTMEYVEGTTLASMLARRPLLAEADAARIVREMARGLAHAHERGIVHRDLKPENVMMVDEQEDDPVVKLLDFGLASVRSEARLTRAGQVFGTPQYMAPEQFFDTNVDARADLYSLGVILFEMLAGALPFDAGTVSELARMHLKDAPPAIRARTPASAPSPAIEAIARRLLAKSPDDRFPSARVLADALRPFVQPFAAPVVSIRREPAIPDAVTSRVEAAIRDGAPIYNAGDHAGCLLAYTGAAEELLRGPLARGHVAASARLRVALDRAARAATPWEGAWHVRYAFDDLLHAAASPRPPESATSPLAAEIALAEVVSAPRYAAGDVDLVGDYYVALTLHLAAALRAEGGDPALAYRLDQVAAAATRLGGGQRALSYLRESLAALTALTTSTDPSLVRVSQAPSSAFAEECPGLEGFARRVVQALGVGVPAYNAGDVGACYRVYRQAAEDIVAQIGAGPACARLRARLGDALAQAATLSDDKAAWALRHAFDDLLALEARRRGGQG